MRKLTATICLTIAVLFGSAGVSWGADKSGGDKAAKKLITTLVLVRDLKQLTTYKSSRNSRSATEEEYKPISSSGLELPLFSAFGKGGFELIDYRDLAEDSECNAPKKSKIKVSFVTKEMVPTQMLRAAFKASRKCEINYFMIVTLTLDSLSEQQKGRIIFRGGARVYDVSRRIARTIGIARFKGHSAGKKLMDIRTAVFREVSAKLAGGRVSGSEKSDDGDLLRRLRNRLESRQRADIKRRTLPACDTNIEIRLWDQCAGVKGAYSGEFRKGKRHGWGEQNFQKSGSRVEGQYSNNKRNGWGIYHWKKSGNRYIGHFKNNRKNGWGIYHWKKSGNRYIGQFTNGKRDGWGQIKWKKNGDRYEGEWKDGKITGWGTLNSKKGDLIRVARWKNLRIVGEFLLIAPNGKQVVAYIKDGKYEPGDQSRALRIKSALERARKKANLPRDIEAQRKYILQSFAAAKKSESFLVADAQRPNLNPEVKNKSPKPTKKNYAPICAKALKLDGSSFDPKYKKEIRLLRNDGVTVEQCNQLLGRSPDHHNAEHPAITRLRRHCEQISQDSCRELERVLRTPASKGEYIQFHDRADKEFKKREALRVQAEKRSAKAKVLKQNSRRISGNWRARQWRHWFVDKRFHMESDILPRNVSYSAKPYERYLRTGWHRVPIEWMFKDDYFAIRSSEFPSYEDATVIGFVYGLDYANRNLNHPPPPLTVRDKRPCSETIDNAIYCLSVYQNGSRQYLVLESFSPDDKNLKQKLGSLAFLAHKNPGKDWQGQTYAIRKQARESANDFFKYIRTDYLKREKSLIEQVLNYSTTGKTGGKIERNKNWYFDRKNSLISAEIWVEKEPCVVNRYKGNTKGGKRSKDLDLRKINNTAFRITAFNGVKDDGYLDRFKIGTVKADFERLSKAWKLALKRCPGKRSAF